jgi:hypothetical protein
MFAAAEGISLICVSGLSLTILLDSIGTLPLTGSAIIYMDINYIVLPFVDSTYMLHDNAVELLPQLYQDHPVVLRDSLVMTFVFISSSVILMFHSDLGRLFFMENHRVDSELIFGLSYVVSDTLNFLVLSKGFLLELDHSQDVLARLFIVDGIRVGDALCNCSLKLLIVHDIGIVLHEVFCTTSTVVAAIMQQKLQMLALGS